MAFIEKPNTTKKRILIIRALLTPQSCPYLESEDGKLSYMGQILQQLQPGIKTLPKKGPVRLVSDLENPIMYFTRVCRTKIVQTDLCSEITNMQPSPENERRLATLLKDLFTVEFE